MRSFLKWIVQGCQERLTLVDTDFPERYRRPEWAGDYDLTVENGEVLYRKVDSGIADVIQRGRLRYFGEIGASNTNNLCLQPSPLHRQAPRNQRLDHKQRPNLANTSGKFKSWGFFSKFWNFSVFPPHTYAVLIISYPLRSHVPKFGLFAPLKVNCDAHRHGRSTCFMSKCRAAIFLLAKISNEQVFRYYIVFY